MYLKVEVYYKSEKTGKYKLFYETITEEDIKELMEKRIENSRPLWMDENWKFNSITVDEVKV